MDLRLAGRTVIVTGASSGVGLATARMLLAEGAHVAGCAREIGRLRAAFEGIGDPAALHLATCDVTDRESVEQFVAGVVERFGGVDGLVCNAGRSLMATLPGTTDDQIREEFELKIFGSWNLVRATRAALAESESGSVVNVNAILSRQPETKLAVTSAARAALLNLTHSMAEELAADGTRVNSVLLGLVDTGQWRRRFESSGTDLDYDDWSAEIAADRGIALGRFGTAEEVAFPILTLLSPLAGYTTGSSIDVGGGVGRYI
ncbi:SDR family oxidoreductase [Rhodococcus rhodnii]|uniref:Short chain dehydrogenase n=2 Tax=Rhodococcus rhodnii TaxID=38312 RepID=R7WHG0_9NOCA|nr:SDR family oxidoreductase [Rhodococcus rhodnii]EOM74482.1 short chain dehydrogenase [Rhodococcus rhodnii LMG 5362]TXG89173.1 SDR family oxidoreductase [Rhodococcus rhodnii]